MDLGEQQPKSKSSKYLMECDENGDVAISSPQKSPAKSSSLQRPETQMVVLDQEAKKFKVEDKRVYILAGKCPRKISLLCRQLRTSAPTD